MQTADIAVRSQQGTALSKAKLLPALGLALLVLLGSSSSYAQDKTVEGFSAESLSLRTALHYDSMLPLPLDALVRLYADADRIDELVGLYRNHIEEYPDDPGAKVVLIRILTKTEREGVGELLTSASTKHGDFAPLQYLLFQFLEEKGDERSLEALSRAIDLQPNPAKRNQWLEELLQRSESESGRAIASEKLAALLAAEGQTAETYLSLVKLMQRYSFWNLSLEALDLALEDGLATDQKLEAEMLLARAQAEIGNRVEAGKILDGILERLAPDHWRRQEAMTFRVSVIASEEERLKMLADYRKAFEENTKNESAALEYAELLNASEKKAEAGAILVAAAPIMGSGGAVETRSLALLEVLAKPDVSEAFLSLRLEDEPERTDLRFRLVKARYALGKDADAEQDFAAVIAGLDKDEASKRILELQRYLRGIERIDAAGIYLARYVRNHPAELSVARELAEIWAARERRDELDAMFRNLTPENSPPEQVRDFVEFLISESFYVPARRLLEVRGKAKGFDFDLGLLEIEVVGELGDLAATDVFVAKMREMTDTPERYAQWLEASVGAYECLERLDEFFAREQNRFSFSRDAWPEEKVEKFVILCEIGKQRLLTDRVASSVRERLGEATLERALRVRLRRFLVGMLESDPASSGEVEEQLKLLAVEDPGNQAEYDLRLALVYHRSDRADLARDLVTGAELREITDAKLVQEAVEVLIEYEFLSEAEGALEAVNRLVPEDVFSWEKRLTLLAVIGDEEKFRSVVRTLRDGDGGVDLGEPSLASLERHFAASYWRSISRLIATRDVRRFEEVLPMLESVHRDSEDFAHRAWTNWARAIVLQTLGRPDEALEALASVQKTAAESELDAIKFPDGMSLSLGGAKKLLEPVAEETLNGGTREAEFVSGNSEMGWAFSVESGSSLVQVRATLSTVLVLDNRDVVYALDPVSGRLVWKERFASSERISTGKPNLLFADAPAATVEDTTTPQQAVKLARDFAVDGELFFLQVANEMRAYSVEDGSAVWAAELPFDPTQSQHDREQGAAPDIQFRVGGARVVVFDPVSGNLAAFDSVSGKLLWYNALEEEERDVVRKVISINSGLSVDQGLVFAWGQKSRVFDLQTGKPVWTLSGQSEMTFPIRLRKKRETDPANGAEGNDGSDGDEVSFVAANSPVRFDFLSVSERNNADFSSSVIRGSGGTELVNSAGHWAEERVAEGDPSHARLEDGYLWLMRQGSIRRISVRLPVASTELPARGSYVGRVGNHVWFVDGQELHHADFANERTQMINCRDLGGPIRVAKSGNQLVVRGKSGVRLVNAITGNELGFSRWPVELEAFLKEVMPDEISVSGSVESLWQGIVKYSENREPNYCVPVVDQISGGRFFTKFGENTLVCLVRETQPQPPGEVKAVEGKE
ncbi:MAG: PQQ-binding-like beta-propeller repeat protein [Verrucomicrobiales bacterium]